MWLSENGEVKPEVAEPGLMALPLLVFFALGEVSALAGHDESCGARSLVFISSATCLANRRAIVPGVVPGVRFGRPERDHLFLR